MINPHIKKQFKFLRQTDYIYLDNAATTQTHESVVKAVRDALEYAGNPSRSSHTPAVKNEKKVQEATNNIAQFIGADSHEITFRSNTTDCINTAVSSLEHLFQAGDEIIVPTSEHHSNILPFSRLQKIGVNIKFVEVDEAGNIQTGDLQDKLSQKTKLVAFSHSSNVYGNLQPAEELTRLIKDFNEEIFVLVDGAQAIAHTPVNVKEIGCDFYAFSGHKMYGPDGIGVLYVNETIHPQLSATTPGGGTVKNVATTDDGDFDKVTPEFTTVADSLSGGTKNVAGILGLAKAVGFLRKFEMTNILEHERELLNYALENLQDLDDVNIVGSDNPDEKLGLISLKLDNASIEDAAHFMAEKNICVRGGTHCAIPLAKKLGGETLRLSLGVYNTRDDIDAFLHTLERFLDIESGSYINPLHDKYASKDFEKKTEIIHSANDIADIIQSEINEKDNTEVVLMAGHAIGIPSYQHNRFYPSIPELMTPETRPLLSEFDMDNFSKESWTAGAATLKKLKAAGIQSRINILFNDTTGINELYKSSHNTTDKSASEYRKELLDTFAKEKGDLPKPYEKTLEKYSLSHNDLMLNKDSTYFRETRVRERFQEFISRNKETFRGMIEYHVDNNADEFDLEINILNDQSIKTCTFDMFSSKTGGIFCTAEVAQFIAEMRGVPDADKYDYVSDRITNPQSEAENSIVVMLTPGMCDNAVTRGAELYRKIWLEPNNDNSFTFINIPFGPKPNDDLRSGSEAKILQA